MSYRRPESKRSINISTPHGENQMFQFTIVLFKFFGFIKTIFEWLFKNPKVLIAAVLIAIAAFTYHKVSTNIAELHAQVEEERAQKVAEKTEKEKAIAAAAESQATINRLIEEKKLAEQSSKDLRNKIARDRKTLDDFLAQLNTYTEQDNGPISKVMVDAVKTIQESRKGR